MAGISSADVAIAEALSLGTLNVTRRTCRVLGEPYWAISDAHGLIEVALTEQQAADRLADVRRRIAR